MEVLIPLNFDDEALDDFGDVDLRVDAEILNDFEQGLDGEDDFPIWEIPNPEKVILDDSMDFREGLLQVLALKNLPQNSSEDSSVKGNRDHLLVLVRLDEIVEL